MIRAITVNTIKRICEADEKDWAILIAGKPNSTQFTTWGKSPENKVYASDLSDYISKELCGSAPEEVYESFKLDAAKNKARVEKFSAWIDDMISRYNPGWNSTVLMQEIIAMQQKLKGDA